MPPRTKKPQLAASPPPADGPQLEGLPPDEAINIEIPPPNVFTLSVPIRGITPLMICRFDEKTRAEVFDKMEGKAQNKRPPKQLDAEGNAARYQSPDGWDGFHAGSVRAAMIAAARNVKGLTMTALKQAIFVIADGRDKDGVPLVRIEGKRHITVKACRTTTGVIYPRARPEYFPWSAVVKLQLNGHILSAQAAVNLLSHAGFYCGIGEHRPTSPKSMTGDNGRFEVVTEKGG